ncbi:MULTISPECIES: hypothetical protein [Gordonia]|uniref:hypothetical protein n=1 Tax=Gordonia TaxID=2053 RepID=UPI0012FE6C1A|nr:hypothetical protein [Gordonia sp. 1D]UOG21051.1 hypothetical protein MTX80_18865 [Gordonia amicalis]
MVVLEALRLALAVALLIGIRTVAVSVAMAIVLVIGGGLANSFGKVDHFILFEILPAVMALAGWGAAFSLDSRRETVSRPTRDNGAVILAWAAIVAFALFTAAVPKALRGWLDPARQATHGYIARDLADSVKLGPFGPELMEIKSALFWKALDYGTVVAEASLVVLIFFPIAFRIGIAVLVIFHIGVYLGLGIEFDSYAFVYFPFFAAPVMNLIRRVQSTRSKEYQDTSQTDIARASDGV